MRRHAPGGEGDFAGKLRLPVPDTFTGQPADWEECAECHGALRLTFRFFKAYIYMFGTGAVTLLERAVRVLFLAVRAESSSSESSHATCGDLCHLVPSLSTPWHSGLPPVSCKRNSLCYFSAQPRLRALAALPACTAASELMCTATDSSSHLPLSSPPPPPPNFPSPSRSRSLSLSLVSSPVRFSHP